MLFNKNNFGRREFFTRSIGGAASVGLFGISGDTVPLFDGETVFTDSKNGAEVIHLATGFVVGYPPCPYTIYFKNFIESYYDLPVVIGTHPIPLKYLKAHKKLPSLKEIEILALYMLKEDKAIMKAYN